MFKRILKIIGITLGLVAVVVGLGFGIYAIGGGFKNEEIVIQALYFDSETETTRVDYSLDDVTVTINCTPKNATDKKLELSIIDDVGVLDNAPTSVIAGQPFKLKIKKDADGNNIGGVVNITATKGTGFVKYTLISDVAIPNDVVYFGGGENASNHPIDGITMAISPEEERHIYLNSSLINAFYLDAGKDGKLNNLKEIEIGYDYYMLEPNPSNPDGPKIKVKDESRSKVFAKDELVPTKSQITDKYYFEIPIRPTISGVIDVYAKMHRTKEIQDAYINGGFKIFETAKTQSEVSGLFEAYSDFFNQYTKYFDIDETDYEDLIDLVTMEPDGTVSFRSLASVRESLNYVYVKASIEIEVVDADIESITSELNVTPKEDYVVNKSVTYDLKQLITEYSLNAFIKSAQTSFTSSDYSYFRDLVVTPVLYLTKGDVEGGAGEGTNIDNKYDASIWGQFDTYGVYKTIKVNNQDVTNFEQSNNKERFKKITKDKVTPTTIDDGYAGYLIKLNKTLENRSNYLTITKNDEYDENGIPSWTFTFNIPKTSVIGDCLYVMFEMTSENPSTGVKNYSYAFTPISITYDEASQSEVMEFDGFDNNNHTNMTITSNLNDANYKTQQYLSIKGNATTSATYKDIMYFAEQTSNNPENAEAGVSENESNINILDKKIVSVGTYQFRWLDDTLQNNGDISPILFGERIPTYDSVKKQFYIDPINVTNGADVKIFAVRYLTDKDGNPIDKYGRVIDFKNEGASSIDNPIELVILDITQTMGTCSIDAFAEKINFYTDNASELKSWTLETDGSQLAFTGKRNNFNINYSDDADKFLSMADEINADLRLKLLYNLELTLYVSNMDLTAGGDGFTIIGKTTEYNPTNLVYPNGDGYNGGLIFNRNNSENDKNAFMKLINKSGNSNDYELDYAVSDFNVEREAIDLTTEVKPYITFKITPKESAIDTSASFAIKASNNAVSATTNLNATHNKVSYVVNQLEVTGTSLNLGELSNYNNNVNVKYANNNNVAGQDLSSANSHLSPNGELSFTTNFGVGKEDLLDGIQDVNNLIIGDDSVDRSVVDMSIDIGDSESGLIKYIEDNTKTRISEIYVPDIVYKLSQDLEFVATEIEGNEGQYIIKIAGEEIIIDGTTFSRCGMTLTVVSNGQGGHCVKIPAGTLLPEVEKDGKSFVYLLDYLFEIKDPAGNPYIMSENNNGSSAGITADFYFTNSLGHQIKYNNRNYFSDYSNPINADGTVNFTYGEEFVNDGLYTGAPAFIIVKSQYSYGATNEVKEFYNAIQFELKQEDIELFAKDATGVESDFLYDDPDFIKDPNNIGDIKYYRFNSGNPGADGNKLKITLKNIVDKVEAGVKSINLITTDTATDSNVFAKYVEFDIIDASVEQFVLVDNTYASTITPPVHIDDTWNIYILAPKSINDEFATLRLKFKNKYHMSDPNQPEYIYKYIRLQVGGPTLEFKPTEKITTVNGNYKLEIDPSIISIINPSDWSNYFTIPRGYTLQLVKESGSTCTVQTTIEDGKTLTTLTPKVVYVNRANGQLEESRYAMKIKGNGVTLNVTTKLSVVVKPTYYVEIISGIDNIRFTTGDKIFGNVIKMYNSQNELIEYNETNKSIYDTLMVSLKDGNGNSIFDVENNIIAYTGMDDITNAVMHVSLTSEDSNLYTPSTGGINGTYSNIKINGIKIKYDESGDIESNLSTAEIIDTTATRTIQLIVNIDKNINISDFFNVSLGNKYTVAIRDDNDSLANSIVTLDLNISEDKDYSILIIDDEDNVVAEFANITIKFIASQITIMYDSDGDNSYIQPSILDTNTEKTITLTASAEGNVDLAKYFTSVTSTTNENIAVGIKVKDTDTIGVGGVIVISGDVEYDKPYNLCVYYVGSNTIAQEYTNIKIQFAKPTV